MKKLIYISLVLFSFFSLSIASAEKDAEKAEEVAESSKSETKAKPIHYVRVDGVVAPVMSEYLIKSIEDAEKAGAGLTVIEIDTPGGLDLSMRDIIKAIMASEVPVAVYVAPSGSRAASAGVFITYASHIASMAPGTNIGSAHPVPMGGGEMDEVMLAKVENDAIAYIKSIAEKRGRNVEWAELAVKESVNITAEEALEKGVIEYVADSKEELLEKINGIEVETVTGKVTVVTKGAEIKVIEMGTRFSLLKAITDPNVAYILMMIGFAGLYFEFSNPGAMVPGVVGAISLIMAFYAFQSLSVNYAGLILVVLAVILFAAEIMVSGTGILAIAGVVALVLGSIMLFDSPIPELNLSMWVLVPTVTCVTAFFAGVAYFVVKSRQEPSVSGIEGMLGMEAEAVLAFSGEGKVFFEGEYWEAESSEAIEKGEKVLVYEIDGLKAKVRKK